MSTVSPAEPQPGPEAGGRAPAAEAARPTGRRGGCASSTARSCSCSWPSRSCWASSRSRTPTIYWHLRTGDLIRKTGADPARRLLHLHPPGTPWIDLHWIFQVGISWLNEHGGVPALTLAKAVITCLAVFLLITARRRSWPIWAMVLAWLPALLVLGGRMYVRPETLSLLYLAIYLAVALPLGPIPRAGLGSCPSCRWRGSTPRACSCWGRSSWASRWSTAALRRGAFAPERRRWWQTVVPACVAATGLACLLNPYGIHGAPSIPSSWPGR